MADADAGETRGGDEHQGASGNQKSHLRFKDSLRQVDWSSLSASASDPKQNTTLPLIVRTLSHRDRFPLSAYTSSGDDIYRLGCKKTLAQTVGSHRRVTPNGDTPGLNKPTIKQHPRPPVVKLSRNP